MKTLYKSSIYLLLACLFSVNFASCDFLDVVPDEQEKEEDSYADEPAARRYLSSCYSFIPHSRTTNSLDFFTGDEVITSFEHETFSSFPKGNYTASRPVISYWNTLFSGIRQSYMYLDKLNTPGTFLDLSDENRADYRAQATFLIAYYHYLLARCYGPILLVKETPNLLTPAKDFLARTPYEECVDWICNKFQEAIDLGLKEQQPADQFGLATSVAAKALIAKMRLYAASPLFNGNSDYEGFTNKDGTPLISTEYDQQKWVNAMKDYEAAIAAAEKAGHKLYDATDAEINANSEPSDPIQRRLRYVIMDYSNQTVNPEVIWADTRPEDNYSLQNKSLPTAPSGWNGLAPTLTMVKRFYTKNGLPIDEDPEFVKADQFFDITTVDEAHAHEAALGVRTFELNLNREPRFYAWVAFQGGFYEILSSSNKGPYNKDKEYIKWSDLKTGKKGKMECDFVLGGNCSRAKGKNAKPRSGNYSPSGYLNKKGINPTVVKLPKMTSPKPYPWPIIRLAELYLGYAEACVECDQLEKAKIYLNKVRQRAGIPNVEDSWAKVPGVTLNKEKMRQIVRQERQIEFYLENQNFWDIRRWKLGEKYFNVKAHGMNIMGKTLEDFCHEEEIEFERKFISPTHYLMPIPISDINKNVKLVNNPGY